MSRKIEDLHPFVQNKCMQFVQKCKEKGIEVLITCTKRTKEEQNELYAKGRTTDGPIVTHVKDDESMHYWGLAWDFVPMVNGKPSWNDQKLWDTCGKIAQSLEIEWGGVIYTNFVDKPHCQYTKGLTLSDLREGKTLDQV